MLGRAVAQVAATRTVPVFALSRTELDITDHALVSTVIRQLRPRAVLNLAAYTAVDRAESEPDCAMAVNEKGAASLAAATLEVGARMIHVSTDYVFDGSSQRPYRPDDRANPINVYGRTKWLGEEAIRARLEDHVIIRTSWLFAPWGNNFVRMIVERPRDKKPLHVVADQCGRPTAAVDLASVLLDLAEQPEVRGTVHFANAGPITWHGFAEAIVGMLGELGAADIPKVIPVSTADRPTPAVRPPYSVLDTDAFTAATGIIPRSWRAGLAETLAELR